MTTVLPAPIAESNPPRATIRDHAPAAPASGTPPPQDTLVTGPGPNEPTPAERATLMRHKALLRFAMSITALTLIGHLLLGFEQAPIVPVAAVVVAYVTSIALERLHAWVHDRRPDYAGGRSSLFYFLLPSHIAALACSMLLYGQSLGIYLFAVVVSVGSKYVFRVRSNGRTKHFLNPSNFGISVALITMPWVGFVPPYMFLNRTDQPFDWLIPAGVLTAGTLLNAKLTRRIPLIAGWVGGYLLQAVIRDVLFDDNLWATLGMMTGVAFVLFTNYMITDPGTTPASTRGQVAFGLATAAVYGLLITTGVAYAIFFALIIVCAGRGALIWTGQRRRDITARTAQHA